MCEYSGARGGGVWRSHVDEAWGLAGLQEFVHLEVCEVWTSHGILWAGTASIPVHHGVESVRYVNGQTVLGGL